MDAREARRTGLTGWCVRSAGTDRTAGTVGFTSARVGASITLRFPVGMNLSRVTRSTVSYRGPSVVPVCARQASDCLEFLAKLFRDLVLNEPQAVRPVQRIAS